MKGTVVTLRTVYIIVNTTLLTQFFWDMVLFLPTGYRYLRFATWSLSKCAFIVNRFSTAIIVLSSALMVLMKTSRNNCVVLYAVYAWFNGLSVSSAFLVFNARLGALYQGDPLVNLCLSALTYVLAVTFFALAIAIVVLLDKHLPYNAPDAAQPVCYFRVQYMDIRTTIETFNHIVLIIQLVYAGIILAMSLYKSFRRQFSHTGNLSLHRLLVLQGGYYFSVLFLVFVAATVVSLLANTVRWVLITPTTAWMSMVVTRVVYQQFYFNREYKKNHNMLVGVSNPSMSSALGTPKAPQHHNNTISHKIIKSTTEAFHDMDQDPSSYSAEICKNTASASSYGHHNEERVVTATGSDSNVTTRAHKHGHKQLLKDDPTKQVHVDVKTVVTVQNFPNDESQ